MITEKQIKYIQFLANTNSFFILRDLSQLSNRDGRMLIDFMKDGKGEYDMFRRIIRKRGPKIKNLVGDYLFEDNHAWESLR
jgi:hypothetical protein